MKDGKITNDNGVSRFILLVLFHIAINLGKDYFVLDTKRFAEL